MIKPSHLIMVGALLVTSFAATGQDNNRNNDYFGQTPAAPAPQVESTASLPTPKRSISNTVGGERQRPVAPAEGRERIERERMERDERDPRGGLRERNERGELLINGKRVPDTPGIPSEFQKFIFDSTGQTLPLFGAGFFSQGAATYAPLGNTPVPSDYTLGAGDELLMRGWGTIDIDFKASIDRNGLISIPTVGTIVLAGVRAQSTELNSA